MGKRSRAGSIASRSDDSSDSSSISSGDEHNQASKQAKPADVCSDAALKKHKRGSGPEDSSSGSEETSSDEGSKKRSKQRTKKVKDGKKTKAKGKDKHKKKKKSRKKSKTERRGRAESGPVQLSKFMQEAVDKEGAKYSVVSGKKIKLKRDKSQADLEQDKSRRAYLEALNAAYDSA